MDLEILEKIGLTKGESRVYITLLKIGQSSVGPIINAGDISRSKVYDVLGRLIKKGLVGVVTQGKIKKFSAVPPRRIDEFLTKQKRDIEEQEKTLQKILPSLQRLPSKNSEARAEIFHGPRGIRAFFDMSLYQNHKKEEILVLGYAREASMYFHAYFRKHHKKRIELKIPAKVIYDYETWFLKKRKKRKYVKQAYLPKGITTPASVWIFGDVVGTIVFTKEQKLCFMIKNKTTAKGYKDYFKLLWKDAIKE